MSVRSHLALVPTLALALAACGGSGSAPTAGNPTGSSQPTTAPSSSPAATQMAVRVYFLRGDKVVSVHRDVPVTGGAVGKAALLSLLAGPADGDRAAGISTAVPATSRMLGLEIHDGIADVNFSAAYESGGGSLSMTARLMQVVFTLTQFATVHRVVFRIEGTRVTTFGGEGVMLDHPVIALTTRPVSRPSSSTTRREARPYAARSSCTEWRTSSKATS